MYSEQRLIPEFDVQEMVDKVVNTLLRRVDKSLSGRHVVFEKPIYEKVNDELWYIYFTSKSSNTLSNCKVYHQVVMGFACITEHYYDMNVIGDEANYTLADLKAKFRNYLKALLRYSDEEPVYDSAGYTEQDR